MKASAPEPDPQSSRKPVHIIVACSENRVIGRAGTLPWRIREDFRHLFDSVKGGIVVEGRRVFEELKRPYPGTKTIVLSRDSTRSFPGCHQASSLDDAIALANSIPDYSPIWIGGGQSLYEESMKVADLLYLTLVHTQVTDGDTFFPDWRNTFSEVISERSSSDANHRYTFYILGRKHTSQ